MEGEEHDSGINNMGAVGMSMGGEEEKRQAKKNTMY